jgi:putative ABC transport system permease protein
MGLRLLKNDDGVETRMQSRTMWNLAIKNIFYNKRRSLLIIFTIMLSVCLVFSVMTYWNSYRSLEKREALEKEGEYHAEYMDVGIWQLKRIGNNHDICGSYITYKAADVHIVNEDFVGNYITPQAVSFEDLEKVYHLYAGHMPHGEDEIVMDRWVMETLGLGTEPGTKIRLSLGIADKDTGEVCQIERDFQIVGILGDIESLRAGNISYVIFDKGFLDSISKEISYNVKIRLRSNFESRKQVEDLAFAMGIREENINYNTAYLDAFSIEIMDIFGLAVIISLILFIAVIVVLNIYNIYFGQNIRIYGLFKAIGATDLQLRIFVFYESLVLGSLGIIAGIAAGTGMSFCVVPLTNKMNKGMTEIITDISALSFLTATVAGYFIVLFASSSPLRKMMQISVKGAYRYNPVNMKNRNVGKLAEKISIKYLAYTYISRYKRKLAFNILSVTSTFILFIVAGSIIGSMNLDSLTSLTIGGDYSIQISDTVSRGLERIDLLDADFLNELDNYEEIESYHTIMYERIWWAEQSAQNHIELPEEYIELGIGYGDIASILYGYDSEFLEGIEKYITAGTFDLKLLETGEYIIAVDDGISNISPGDVLYFNDSDGSEFAVRVLGIVSNNITYRGYKASGCDLIVHQNLLEHLGMDTRIQRIVISSGSQRGQDLKIGLQEMLDGREDIVLVSYVDLKRELEEKKNMISVISHGFLLVLFLIVVFNLVNTTFTNVLSRKKELGILEAIGLTLRQEKRLLQFESFYIVAVSSLIGMVIGYPVGYIAFLLFKKQADYAVYYFPIMENLLLAALLWLLQWFIVNRCSGLLEKQSVVEKIRYKE